MNLVQSTIELKKQQLIDLLNFFELIRFCVQFFQVKFADF